MQKEVGGEKLRPHETQKDHIQLQNYSNKILF